MVMRPERIAEVIVKVVELEIAPEVSVPRSLAALQILRVLMPPVYRLAMRKASTGRVRPTRAPEAD
jgi:hypothetical protein